MFHDVATGHADVGLQVANYAISIPVAIYLLALLFAPVLFSEALVPIAAIMVVTVALRNRPELPRNRSALA